MSFKLGEPIKGRPKNPYEEGTIYEWYFDVFTREIAPSDADVVKEAWRKFRHKTSVPALQTFRHKVKTGAHPSLKGRRTKVCLQPRSDLSELAQWWKGVRQVGTKRRKQ